VRTLLARAASERIAVPDLHRDFKEEWNQFAASLEAVVQLNETPNVASFCDDKLAFVRHPIEAVRTRLATGNPRAATRQAFDALDAAFGDRTSLQDYDELRLCPSVGTIRKLLFSEMSINLVSLKNASSLPQNATGQCGSQTSSSSTSARL
jgi:hypothetical protein